MNGPEIVFGTSGTVANIKQVNIAFDQMAAASEKATTKAASSVESMSKWLKTATADIKKAEKAFDALGGMKGVNLDHLKKMLGHLKDLKQPLTEAESRFIRLSKQIEFFDAKLEHSARVQKLWLVQQTAQMDAVFKTQSALAKLTAEYSVLKSAEGLELANMKAMTEARKRLNAALAANTKVTIRDNAAAKVNQAEADSAVKLRTAIEMLAIKTREYQGLVSRGAQQSAARLQVEKAHYESLVREQSAVGLLNIKVRESKAALDSVRVAKEAEIALNNARRQSSIEAANAEKMLWLQAEKLVRTNQSLASGGAGYLAKLREENRAIEQRIVFDQKLLNQEAELIRIQASLQSGTAGRIATVREENKAIEQRIVFDQRLLNQEAELIRVQASLSSGTAGRIAALREENKAIEQRIVFDQKLLNQEAELIRFQASLKSGTAGRIAALREENKAIEQRIVFDQKLLNQEAELIRTQKSLVSGTAGRIAVLREENKAAEQKILFDQRLLNQEAELIRFQASLNSGTAGRIASIREENKAIEQRIVFDQKLVNQEAELIRVQASLKSGTAGRIAALREENKAIEQRIVFDQKLLNQEAELIRFQSSLSSGTAGRIAALREENKAVEQRIVFDQKLLNQEAELIRFQASLKSGTAGRIAALREENRAIEQRIVFDQKLLNQEAELIRFQASLKSGTASRIAVLREENKATEQKILFDQRLYSQGQELLRIQDSLRNGIAGRIAVLREENKAIEQRIVFDQKLANQESELIRVQASLKNGTAGRIASLREENKAIEQRIVFDQKLLNQESELIRFQASLKSGTAGRIASLREENKTIEQRIVFDQRLLNQEAEMLRVQASLNSGTAGRIATLREENKAIEQRIIFDQRLLNQEAEILRTQASLNSGTAGRIAALREENKAVEQRIVFDQRLLNQEAELTRVQASLSSGTAGRIAALREENKAIEQRIVFDQKLLNQESELIRTQASLKAGTAGRITALREENKAIEQRIVFDQKLLNQEAELIRLQASLSNGTAGRIAALREENKATEQKILFDQRMLAQEAELARVQNALKTGGTANRVAILREQNKGLEQEATLNVKIANTLNTLTQAAEPFYRIRLNSIAVQKEVNKGAEQEATLHTRLQNTLNELTARQNSTNAATISSIAVQKERIRGLEQEAVFTTKLANTYAMLEAKNKALQAGGKARDIAILSEKNKYLEQEAAYTVKLTNETQRLLLAQDPLNAAVRIGNIERQTTISLEDRAAKVRAEYAYATDALTRAEWAKTKAEQQALQTLAQSATFEERKIGRLKELERSIAYLRTEEGRRTAALETETQAQKRLNDMVARSTPQMRALLAQIQKLEQEEARLVGTTYSLAGAFSVGNQSAAALRSMLAGLGAAFGSFTSATMLVSVAIFAVSRAFKDMIASGANYGDALARVGAISSSAALGTQAYADTLARLDTEAMRIAATSRFMGGEVIQAMSEMAMAGLKVDEIIMGTADVMKLAAIGALNFGEASDIATNIMMGFQIPIADLGRVVDVMAEAVTNSNQNIQQMGNAMSYAAPVANAFGVSLEFVSAATMVLSNSGIKASRAGTGLRRIISSLFTPTQKGAKAMRQYGVTVREVSDELQGIEGLENAVPGMFKGAAYGTDALVEKLKRLYVATNGATENLDALLKIADIRAAPAFIQLIKSMGAGEKSLLALTESMGSVTGASSEMFEKIQTSLKSDWLVFLGAIDTIKKRIFETQGEDASGWLKGITSPFQIIAKDKDMIEEAVDATLRLVKALGELLKLFLLFKAVTLVRGAILGIAAAATTAAAAIMRVVVALGLLTAQRAAAMGFAGLASGFAALTGAATAAGGALAFLLSRIVAPIAVIGGVVALAAQFVDFGEILDGVSGTWDNLTNSMDKARVKSQETFDALTEGGGLAKLYEKRAGIDEQLSELYKTKNADSDILKQIEDQKQARKAVTKEIQDANQALEEHASFYMIEGINKQKADLEQLRKTVSDTQKELNALRTTQVVSQFDIMQEAVSGRLEDTAWVAKKLFSELYDVAEDAGSKIASAFDYVTGIDLTASAAGSDEYLNKRRAELMEYLSSQELLLINQENIYKRDKAIQEAYAGTDATRMVQLQVQKADFESQIAALNQRKNVLLGEISQLEQRGVTNLNGSEVEQINRVKGALQQLDVELGKLREHQEKIREAETNLGGTPEFALETAIKMANEATAAYDALGKSLLKTNDEMESEKAVKTLRDLYLHNQRILVLREQLLGVEQRLGSITDEGEKNKLYDQARALRIEVTGATEIMEDESKKVMERLQGLAAAYDPVIAKANDFRKALAEITELHYAKTDIGLPGFDTAGMVEALKRAVTSTFELDEATGKLTAESRKAAQQNLALAQSALAVASAYYESFRATAANLRNIAETKVSPDNTAQYQALINASDYLIRRSSEYGNTVKVTTAAVDALTNALSDNYQATLSAKDIAELYKTSIGMQADILERAGMASAALALSRRQEMQETKAQLRPLQELLNLMEDLNDLQERATSTSDVTMNLRNDIADMSAELKDQFGDVYVEWFNPIETTDKITDAKDKIGEAIKKVADLGSESVNVMTGQFDTLEQRIDAILQKAVAAIRQVSNLKDTVTPATVSTMTASGSKAGPVLDLIGRAEAPRGYDQVWNGYEKKAGTVTLTDKTLAEVLSLQKQMISSSGHGPVGRYQFASGTLKDQIDDLGLAMDTKFTPAVQDMLAGIQLASAGYDDWVSGIMSTETFLHNLSKVWAGLPTDASGKSYYQKDGVNKATVGWNESVAYLNSAKEGAALGANTIAITDTTAAVTALATAKNSATAATTSLVRVTADETAGLSAQEKYSRDLAQNGEALKKVMAERLRLQSELAALPDGTPARAEALVQIKKAEADYQLLLKERESIEKSMARNDVDRIKAGEQVAYSQKRSKEALEQLASSYGTLSSKEREFRIKRADLIELTKEGLMTQEEFTKAIEEQTDAYIASQGPLEEYWVNLKKSIPTAEELGIELFDDLKGKLIDALVDGGEFKMDDFVKMVKRKLAELAVNTIIVNIVGNITGLTGKSDSLIGDAMSAIGGGGQGGLLSNLTSLSGIKNLFTGNSLGTSMGRWVSGLGAGQAGPMTQFGSTLAGIPNWALGLGSIGGSLLGSSLFGNKGYSGIGSSVGSLAGSVGGASMSALLGAVGSIVPGIGTIIGGLLGGLAGGGLGSLFGGDKTPKQGAVSTSFSGFGFEDNAKAQGAFGLNFGIADKGSKNIDGAKFQAAYDGMAQVSQALASFYGSELSTEIQVRLRESLGDFKGYGKDFDRAFEEIFSRIIGAARDAGMDEEVNMGRLMEVATGQLSGTSEQMANQIDAGMAKVKTTIALFDTDIGKMLGMGTGQYYDGLEASVVALNGYVNTWRQGLEQIPDTLTRIVTGLGVLQSVADATGMELEGLSGDRLIDISQAFIRVMTEMGITIEQLTSLQDTYNNVFLTEQQRAEMQIKNSVSELKKWNEATKVLGDTQIDSTTEWEAARAAIKKYTDGLDKSTEAGMKAYLAVLQLSSSFGQLGEAIESLKSTKVQDFVDSITPDYVGANEMLQMFKDWGIVIPETSEALYNMIKANVFSADQLEILANNADKLGTMWSYIADQIGKARDELIKAAQKAYDLKVEAENKRYDDEVEKIRADSDARKDALREAYDAKVEAINDEIEKLTDAIADFKSAFEASTKALRSLLELTDGPDQTRQRYVSEALAAIESLKKGIVPKNMDDIINGLSSVDQNDFANREDWLKAVEENRKLLEEINSLTGGKTDSMQAQIDLLKEQLETEKKNFDAAMKAEDDRLEKELKEAEKLHKATLDSLEKEFNDTKTAIENASLSELTEMAKTNGTLGSILAVLEAIREGKPINPNPDDGKSLWNNNDAIRKPIWADILKMAFPDLSIEEIYKQGLTDPEGMTFTDAFDKLAKLIPYWSQKGLLDSDEMQKIIEMLAKIGIKLPEQNSLYDPKANADLLKAVMDVVTKGGTVGVTMPQFGADSEAGFYKKLLEIWKGQGQVDDAMYSALTAILKTFNVPGFAKGGLHKGGLRLVGERGPELEYTGPSRIFSNDDLERFFNMAGVQDPDYSQYRIPSSGPTNDDALLAEVRSLREEVKALRNDTNAGNRAIATNTGKVVSMTERWEQIGMPQSRSDIYETP